MRIKSRMAAPAPTAPPEWWPKTLIDETAAAELLGTKVYTLQYWRCRRTQDLPFIKLGASVRYNPADVWAWLCSNTVRAAEPVLAAAR